MSNNTLNFLKQLSGFVLQLKNKCRLASFLRHRRAFLLGHTFSIRAHGHLHTKVIIGRLLKLVARSTNIFQLLSAQPTFVCFQVSQNLKKINAESFALLRFLRCRRIPFQLGMCGKNAPSQNVGAPLPPPEKCCCSLCALFVRCFDSLSY